MPKQKTLAKNLILLLSLTMLSACSSELSWQESYELRQWERSYLSAQTFYTQKNYKEAGKSYKEAIEFANRLEKDHNKQAAMFAGLANCYKQLDSPEKAESNYIKAVSLLRKNLTGNLSASERKVSLENLSHNLFLLGVLHSSMDEHESAEHELQESLGLLDKLAATDGDNAVEYTDSREHAYILFSLFQNELASGKNGEAEKTAAQLFTDQLRFACPAKHLADVQKKYLKLLNNEGKTKDAKRVHSLDLWLQAIKNAEDSLSAEDLAASEKFYRESLKIAKEDANSPSLIAASYEGLGSICAGQRKWHEAKSYYRLSLKEREESEPCPSEGQERMLKHLVRSEIFEALPVVEPTMLKWMKLCKELYNDHSINIAPSLVTSACIYDRNNNQDKAELCAKEAYELLKNVSIAPSETQANITWLADLEFFRGRLDEAKHLYMIASKHYTKSPTDFARKSMYLILVAEIEYLEGNEARSDALFKENKKLLLGLQNPSLTLMIDKLLAFKIADLQRHKQTKAAAWLAKSLTQIVPPAGSEEQTLIMKQAREITSSVLDDQAHNKISSYEILCAFEKSRSLESAK